MIDPGKRNAIYQLHLEGMSQREISRLMCISRKAVKRIIEQRGKFDREDRQDKMHVDRELLERLYRECNGWIERMHEKLKEEENITIGYSTLTRMLREQGIGQAKSTRCDRVPDEPGAEMQHDTTIYQVPLAGVRTRLVASVIYLRYSKRKYLKFYRSFNRFKMKCFLHEALMFWEHSAHICVIDNTNLARLRGAGATAIIVPEMAEFARRHGFKFLCHAINHPNRKAGNERSFRTVETNFLPGRTFESLEDLNSQARRWATERMDQRPQSKTGLIPAKLFEHECLYLHKLPKHLPAPYQTHHRGTDVYGYVTFCANYYWVPGTKREPVKLLEYADRVTIFLEHGHECLAEYALPPDGTKNQRFTPPGKTPPPFQPRRFRKETRLEEQRLRAIDASVSEYLDFALRAPGMSQRHRFTRELFALSRKITHPIFLQTIERAHRYRILDLSTLRRIAWFCISQQGPIELPDADIDDDFQQRPAYQEGCLTEEPDLSIYDQLNDEDDDEDDEDDEHHSHDA
jgi:transposase